MTEAFFSVEKMKILICVKLIIIIVNRNNQTNQPGHPKCRTRQSSSANAGELWHCSDTKHLVCLLQLQSKIYSHILFVVVERKDT